jgi:predicted Rossmann-fold nucleotide-binding protein
LAADHPRLAVFASDRGPGDAARANTMSQVGALLARRGAGVVCLAEKTLNAVPLVTSVRTAGGEVTLIADPAFKAPAALSGVPVERIGDVEARLQRVSSLADAFIGLPGSLASAAALYRCWAMAGAGGSGKPVILFNRNRAFEAVRGLSADILSHSVPHADRMAVYTDNIDDLWNKIAWALNVSG